MTIEAHMRARTKPTHVLRVEIPLDLGGEIPFELYKPVDSDAVQDALHIALSVSRAAYDGVICDEIQVTSIENPNWPPDY